MPCPRSGGLVPTLQKVAAQAVLEGVLEDLLPQVVNGYTFRRGSDVAVALIPQHLAVERWREQGVPAHAPD